MVDAQLKHPGDNPSIGLLLCKNQNRIVAEYALRDVNKPIGVAEYQLVNALPENLQTDLPSIESIERELGEGGMAAEHDRRTAQEGEQQDRQRPPHLSTHLSYEGAATSGVSASRSTASPSDCSVKPNRR